MSIKLTEAAIKEIKHVLNEQNRSLETTALEVGVFGGGCSGLSYKLGFKETDKICLDGEQVETIDGLTVAIDKASLKFMEGTEIDYYSGLDKRGFVFNNPLAGKGCGCGSSFTPKEETDCGSCGT